MGLALLFLAGCVLFGVPLALTLLVFVINAPWILIPILGIACLIYYVRQRRERAQDEELERQRNETSERFDREIAELRKQIDADLEASRRHDQKIVDWLEMRRRERE